MTPLLAGKSVGIWGLGVEGLATLSSLARDCERYIVIEGQENDEVRDAAAKFQAKVVSSESLASNCPFKILVRSPGVSIHRQEIRMLANRGVRITSLLEIWLPEAPVAHTIGVTGTKGKSTTSFLISELVRASGVSVELAGNIGRAWTDVRPADVGVLEISSYQAAGLSISPTFGTLTSLDIDHIPWHGSVPQYHADKLNLFANPQLQGLLAHEESQSVLLRFAPSSIQRLRFPSEFGFKIVKQRLMRGRRTICLLAGTPLAPKHLAANLTLACATAEMATGLQLDHAIIANTVCNFQLLPGRMEITPTTDGRLWVNDPLASNPFAAAAAIRHFSARRMILILGGESRGIDPSQILDAIEDHGRITLVVLIGDAGRAWRSVIECKVKVAPIDADDIEGAARLAAQFSNRGDVILFSPGAPTTSSIGSWADRRMLFEQTVRSIVQQPDRT